MAKKIKIIGARPRKIKVTDRPKRRIEPVELATALGASPTGQQVEGDLDPIALADLGTQLLHRLHSSGGRPALADATINCRVPLSAEDVKTLESMLAHIGASTGAKPSIGQLASVIVRLHLNAIKNPDLARQDVEREVSRNILQHLIDERINPIREQLNRLEAEVHAGSPGNE
jgi:hypothetical protein